MSNSNYVAHYTCMLCNKAKATMSCRCSAEAIALCQDCLIKHMTDYPNLAHLTLNIEYGLNINTGAQADEFNERTRIAGRLLIK